MISYSEPGLEIIRQELCRKTAELPFTEKEAESAGRFHMSLPAYAPTALASLSRAAKRYGVGAILVKDESSRFGIKAFKGLGGSYSMFRILCEELSLDPGASDFTTFLDPKIRERCAGIEFVTATDGNHGKGVSWAAKLFGCRAHVYLPAGSSEARRRAIEEAGEAEARVTDLNYDRTVELCAKLAEENGWILIQDTSWEGYERIPRWIVEGYLTMAEEAVSQLEGKVPTHVFLQAGVGAMAGGAASYFLKRFEGREPLIVIAEPTEAACVFRSVLAGDGRAHTVEGDPLTIMAGLNCGTPCGVTWPVLRDRSSFLCACADSFAERGMRAYAHPAGGDPPIVSCGSGAVTYGLLLHILESERLREMFGIGADSVILLVNTEGDTDPGEYARVTGAAPHRGQGGQNSKV